MLIIYNLLFPVAFILYLPVFIIKLLKRGGVDRAYFQRFGIFTADVRRDLRKLDNPVWVHAVSVGEVVAACTFIKRWQESRPDHSFVLSTSTTTGYAMARRKLPDNCRLIYCPLDFYPFVLNTLRLVRPRMLVIFEVEIWPNLLRLSNRRQIPAVLVNARMSDRSACGYAKHRKIFRPLFACFSVICAQSEEDRKRILNVVGEEVPVHVCNSMKFDQLPLPAEVTGGYQEEVLKTAFGEGDMVVWTAASTHAGEEEIMVDVFQNLRKTMPGLKLVLVPRHHERSAEVEKLLNRREIPYNRYTELEKKTSDYSAKTKDCLLVNTTGVLLEFLELSDFVFMGKSLGDNHGGHNIIEPAIFAKPVLHGPNLENFQLVRECFRENNATWEVADAEELRKAVDRLTRDEKLRDDLGRRAKATVDQYRGAVDRTLARISQAGL